MYIFYILFHEYKSKLYKHILYEKIENLTALDGIVRIQLTIPFLFIYNEIHL